MKLLTNFATIVVSLVLALLAGEAAIRLLFGQTIVMYPRFVTAVQYDGVVLRRQIPNADFWHTSTDGHWEFRINAEGFRDDHDYAYDKPAGRLRILVLGDSMAEGHEVDQSTTFSEVLERGLRSEDFDAEVLNTGISGFGTAEELLFLDREGMKYHPDAVVLAFTKTDFLDNVRSGLYAVDQGKLLLRRTEYAPGSDAIRLMNSIPGAAWLSQNSYLFSWLINTAWASAKRMLSKQASEDVLADETIATGDITEYQRQLCAALLRQMKTVTGNAGIPLILVDVPAASASANTGQNWQSAIPEGFLPSIVAGSDLLLSPNDYLRDAQFAAHVPHGYRHISAATHTRIAAALEVALRQLNVVKD